MPLDFSFAGQVRRIDAMLRSRFPNLHTRIFEVGIHQFEIIFDTELQNADEISEEFHSSIRFMTVPVTLSNQVPQSYISELVPLSDEDAMGGMIGLPLRCVDLLNLLTSQFPAAEIIRVTDDPDVREAIVVVRSPPDEDTEDQLRTFVGSFQLPLSLTIQVAPSSEAVTRPDIDDPMFVWAASLRSGAPTYTKQDEIFWFDNIANISRDQFPIHRFPGMRDVASRCYFDLSLGENHMNLRQALLMYDEIWCSIPLAEKQSDFLAIQGLTKADLLEMVSAGRLRILSTQPEERLDVPFLEEAYERNPQAVFGRRTTASLLLANVAHMAEQSLLNDPALLPGLSEFSRECGPIIGVNPNEMLRGLLWPMGSIRGSLPGLLAHGSKGGPVNSLSRLISNRVQEETGLDIALEAYIYGEPVHIGHALDATVFGPIDEPTLYYKLKSVLGGYLNLHENFTGALAESWIRNEQGKRNARETLPAVQVFEFDRHVPIREIIDDISLSSTRKQGRSLYARLADLSEEERAQEIIRVNSKLRDIGRNKANRIFDFTTLETAASLASLFTTFPCPPIMGLFDFGGRALTKLRRNKKIDELMSRLECKIQSDSSEMELSFLSKIDRVARFKSNHV